jgi:thymidylate synthase
MKQYYFNNYAFKETAIEIMQNGLSATPRGLKTKELLAATIVLQNPLNRLILFPSRKTDIFYAIGEFLWYLSGSHSLEQIRYYAPSIEKFSDDGKTLNSAYGYNIFFKWFNQWQECIKILSTDADSRQAIIFIREPNDLILKTKDQICTNTMHFLIRDNKLNLIVNLRSNDFYVGYIFDSFCFTMFQELMAIELGIDVGSYFHFASSLHLYEKSFMPINLIQSELPIANGEMRKMSFNTRDIWSEISDIIKYEQMIREESINVVRTIEDELYTTLNINAYWINILFILIFKRYLIEMDYNNCERVVSFLETNTTEDIFKILLMEKLHAACKTSE